MRQVPLIKTSNGHFDASIELTINSTSVMLGLEGTIVEHTFGNALREHRRVSGLSQRELAQRIGVDFSYISKLENGRLPAPAADTVVSMCRVLQIPADDMLALTGKIPSNVQRTVSTSRVAQQFLHEAQKMQLTDEQWGRMVQTLRSLKDGSP